MKTLLILLAVACGGQPPDEAAPLEPMPCWCYHLDFKPWVAHSTQGMATCRKALASRYADQCIPECIEWGCCTERRCHP